MSSKSEKARERAERARRLAEEQRAKEKRSMVFKVIGVVVVLVVIVAAFWGIGQLKGSSSDSASDVPALGDSEHGLVVGDSDAPHKVVIYEDFLCPYCGELEHRSHDKLSKLADQGKVAVEYRPFVLLSQAGPYSEESASAFAVVKEKAGDEVAHKFHDLLYENQPSEEGPFPKASKLVDLAVKAGAKRSDVAKDIEDEAQKSWADGATDDAQKAKIQGTPTIYLDGKEFTDGSNPDELAKNLIKKVS